MIGLSVRAADLDSSQQDFLAGKYTKCIDSCEQAIREREPPGEGWRLLLARCYLTLGRYTNAQTFITASLERYPSSLPLRYVGYQIWQQSGDTNQAEGLINDIIQTANARPSAYRDAANLVVLGQAAILRGADPKLVLERMFDQAKRTDPECREAYLVSGDLALEKQDFDLAARTFQAGLDHFADDPDFNFGLARAYAPNSGPDMMKALQAALKHNPKHVPSLLLLADHLIDAEDYDAATKPLEEAIAVNPWQPDAWAYRAVLKHLKNDQPGEEQARATALHFWKSNPRVDYLIGSKLSRKYRFAEGAAFQRRALQMDPTFWPASIQLAQDYLRLGQETEGWRLANLVNQNDPYNVVAYNLMTLKDTLAKFQTVTNQDFLIRMSAHEAPLYGAQVLALLDRAMSTLSAKYGLKPKTPVIVEIFPEAKDFTVRTFAIPVDTSYLAVCFGGVITANSPASPASHSANWQATLWHEFTHVITLQMTDNKIPRWLSEGISVYEERQADPAWGQHMNARYREKVLGDDLKKIGALSAAFMAPKDGADLQFAYYESSLAVEFLVERYGMARLTDLLHELDKGTDINRAIELHAAPLAQVETAFVDWAHKQAQNLAPSLTFDKPPQKVIGDDDSPLTHRADIASDEEQDAPEEWIKDHPNNFWALRTQARKLLEAKKYREAKAPLQKLIDGYPDSRDPDNAYRLLAAADRALGETNDERQVLTRFALIEDDAADVFLRLMELDAGVHDWIGVGTNASRYLAVNPMMPRAYRYLAQASEAQGQLRPAADAYQRILLLDPPDPADVHFRLARLLVQLGDTTGGKRHVLQALEEAPRFRAAQKLLLELVKPPELTQGPASSENR